MQSNNKAGAKLTPCSRQFVRLLVSNLNVYTLLFLSPIALVAIEA